MTDDASSHDPDDLPGEVGRQNERTTLAWRRTNLAALGVAALAAKASGEIVVALLVLAAALATSAVVGWQADQRTGRRAAAVDDWLAEIHDPTATMAAPGAIVSATGLTVGLAVVGIAIVLL